MVHLSKGLLLPLSRPAKGQSIFTVSGRNYVINACQNVFVFVNLRAESNIYLPKNVFDMVSIIIMNLKVMSITSVQSTQVTIM